MSYYTKLGYLWYVGSTPHHYKKCNFTSIWKVRVLTPKRLFFAHYLLLPGPQHESFRCRINTNPIWGDPPMPEPLNTLKDSSDCQPCTTIKPWTRSNKKQLQTSNVWDIPFSFADLCWCQPKHNTCTDSGTLTCPNILFRDTLCSVPCRKMHPSRGFNDQNSTSLFSAQRQTMDTHLFKALHQ